MQLQTRKNNLNVERIFRSPTLETVFMVEQNIKKHSGELTRRKIWQKLPRKVMWQTFVTVLNYLESINKIAISRKGVLVYIWNPQLAKKFMRLKREKL